MEPPLHFGEEKMRKERKKRGKKKSAPLLEFLDSPLPVEAKHTIRWIAS
jgi:hypothetical protein